jgi:hypothetical protein
MTATETTIANLKSAFNASNAVGIEWSQVRGEWLSRAMLSFGKFEFGKFSKTERIAVANALTGKTCLTGKAANAAVLAWFKAKFDA